MHRSSGAHTQENGKKLADAWFESGTAGDDSRYKARLKR